MATNREQMEAADRDKLRKLMEELDVMRTAGAEADHGNQTSGEAKTARLGKVYEFLKTDAECEVALEELAEEKKVLEAKKQASEKEKTVDELLAEIAELEKEIASTLAEIEKSSADPKKAKRVASMKEEVTEWEAQKATLETEFKAREKGGVSDVEQLDLLMADIADLRSYFRGKSKQIKWFEEQLKTAAENQKNSVLHTNGGNLSIEDNSRKQALKAEEKKQEVVEHHSRAVRRGLAALNLIEKDDENGASLRQKVGQFLGKEHKDQVGEKREVLNLKPSEMEIKLTLLHAKMEDTVPNRMVLDKYFGSAAYFRRRKYFLELEKLAIKNAERGGQTGYSSAVQLRSEFVNMLKYFFTNQLAVSRNVPDEASNWSTDSAAWDNPLVKWDDESLFFRSEGRGGRSVISFPKNAYELLSNEALRVSLFKMQKFSDREEDFGHFEFAEKNLWLRVESPEKYRHEFDQLLPFLQYLYVNLRVNSVDYYQKFVDLMNREVPGYVTFVPGEGVRIDEKKFPDAEAKLVNSLIADVKIDLDREKAEKEAKRKAEEVAAAEQLRRVNEEFQLDEQRRLQSRADAEKQQKITKISLEEEGLEKTCVDGFRSMSQMVVDREVAKVRKNYLHQKLQAMGEGFMNLFPGEGQQDLTLIGPAVEGIWEALKEKEGLVKPEPPGQFLNIDDFIRKTSEYYAAVERLYVVLKEQIETNEGKVFVRAKTISAWRTMSDDRSRVLAVINQRMGGDFNARNMPERAILQTLISNTNSELAGFQQSVRPILAKQSSLENEMKDKLTKLVSLGDTVRAFDDKKISEVFPDMPMSTILGCLAGDAMPADVVADKGAFNLGRLDAFRALERHFAGHAIEAEKLTVGEFQTKLKTWVASQSLSS